MALGNTMRIYIMRHGQAEVLAGNDSERQLTDAGCFESSQMADWLSEQLEPLQWVLLSPYRRAVQTWRTVERTIPCEQSQFLDELTPSGDAQRVCDYLYALIDQEKLENLLIVSHLPLVSFLVEMLAPGAGAPVFHTAAVACIDYDPKTMLGELLWMQSPHEL